MLQFNELKITPDSKYLIIDVSVKEESYYENVTIDSIVIDTQDTYIFNGPSDKPIFKFDSTNSKIYYPNYELEGEKHVRLILSIKDLNTLPNNMFFVYAKAKGSPSPDTPCGMDNITIMNTVINLYPIYQSSICYLRELNNSCMIPKGFINMILKLKAVELCITTGDYPKAISYWKRFFMGKIKVSTYNCGCNGNN